MLRLEIISLVVGILALAISLERAGAPSRLDWGKIMSRFYEPDLSVNPGIPIRTGRFEQACSSWLLDGHE
jgi:hypothetical protein